MDTKAMLGRLLLECFGGMCYEMLHKNTYL